MPGRTPHRRKNQLGTVLMQLKSQKPSEVWRGMDQVRQWLKDDTEDREIYGMLLDAVKENRELRDRVRDLLNEMMQKGSKSAEQAMLALPSSVQDFLTDANDAYYAAKYDRAIELYRQVLKLDPENIYAKDHIAKAEIKRITGESETDLPLNATEYYRRARSAISARDFLTAMNLLDAAIEAAQMRGLRYPEAEAARDDMQKLLTAEDLRQKAKAAISEERFGEALGLYSQGLELDKANILIKKELEALQDVLRADTVLKKHGLAKFFLSLPTLENTVDTARIILGPSLPLLDSIENKLNKIRLWRTVGIFFSLAIIIIVLYFNGWLPRLFGVTAATPPSISPTSIVAMEATSTVSQETATESLPTPVTATFALTDTSMPTTAKTSTPVATETLMPTATETLRPTATALATGFINKAVASAWQGPNKGLIETLSLNHPLVILEKQEVSNAFWFRCRWESNGQSKEGWILSDNVTLSP